MLKILLSFLSGPISTISNDLKEAYSAKLNSKSELERIAADERISVLEARKTTILAAQADPIERFMRIGFTIPFITYVCKIMIWDKVLGWGITDNLSPDFWNLLYIVVGGYFIQLGVKGFQK